MTWMAHGGSSLFVIVILAGFVLRAMAGRRRRYPGSGTGARSTTYFGPPPGAPGATADPAAGTAGGHTGIPAGWLPDPSGRYERRYWSGSAWTDHVTSGGVPASDPPPGAGPGPGAAGSGGSDPQPPGASPAPPGTW